MWNFQIWYCCKDYVILSCSAEHCMYCAMRSYEYKTCPEGQLPLPEHHSQVATHSVPGAIYNSYKCIAEPENVLRHSTSLNKVYLIRHLLNLLDFYMLWNNLHISIVVTCPCNYSVETCQDIQ